MNLCTLIDAQALAQLARERDVLIVDCRFDLADPAGGAREFAKAHIPGAVYADLNSDLSDLSKHGLGRHPLPDAEAFSAVLGRWGWTQDIPVVAYDDAGGALAAARLWWMLRLVGQREVAVLDGGLAAWKAAGLALSAEIARRKPTRAAVKFDRAKIVYTEQLSQLLQNGQTLLLDARAAPRYRGEIEPIDAVAGHVPGAFNRPFSENLGANGRFKSAAALRTEFDGLLGSGRPADVVNMCGSGVTACHNLLAMEHAGLAGSHIYAPSWSGWSSDRDKAVAIGPK